MSKPIPKFGIMDIDPYVGGLHRVEVSGCCFGLKRRAARCKSLAIEAYERERTSAPLSGWRCGRIVGRHRPLWPGPAHRLRRRVDDIISLLISACGVGDEVSPAHGFLMYQINAKSAGATPVAAPETNLTANVDALLDAVTHRTKMLFLANPNNPTGSYLPADELRRLREGLPDHVLMVIDAAYAEYVSRNDYVSGAELVEKHDNVVMTRTFSKAFGLAAVRLGWAYCPAEVADVSPRRNPFNVTAPAQAAGIAAVSDLSHTDAAIAHNDEWLLKFTVELQNLGYEVAPSVGNFVLVRFDTPEIARSAYDYLLSHGVIGRMMGGYGLPESLRFDRSRTGT